MNTFIDALNELFKLHSKVIKEYEELLFEDEEECEDEDEIDYDEFDYELGKKGYSLRDSLDDNENAILSALENEIISKSDDNYEEYYKMISLLAIEYYNLICAARVDYQDCYKSTKKEMELINIIENSDLSELIGSISDLENDYLLEIIVTIINEYEPEIDYVEEDYDYLYLQDIINDRKVQKVYMKFHPNLKEEIKNFDKYAYHLRISDKVEQIDVDSLFSFIYVHLVVRQLISNKLHYLDIMASKLNQISIDNEKLYKEIVLYLTRFYYVTLKDKKSVNEIEQSAIDIIEEEPKKNVCYLPELNTLITNFYNYDIMVSNTKIDNLSDDMKKKTKKFIKY